MYWIRRDKYYSNDNAKCPYMASYNESMMPVAPCYMTNPNVVQGGCRPCQSYYANAMPFNYSRVQMNPMYNPNFYNYNTMGNMGISMMLVPVEEIED